MGVVFMAEQEQPVHRKVALKIIKPGMDSAQVIARFDAERQDLALMDHQNIARVLDAGATASGRPYFVMELVKGVPITKFCDDNHPTPRERLELFVPVCQAIQHAHQKGIIHRDIKPSNVLVTLYDGKPVPKVIDFGVAKAIEQRLTERTLFTQIGQVVGTLEYMSPEQAEINALDIDTRSHIYSLGVLLYELLTGSTPLEKQKLRSAAFTEMLRMIREEEPPKPSTRLSSSREQLASISAHRKTEPARLTKLVRGELDWIVMKALEKDRSRGHLLSTTGRPKEAEQEYDQALSIQKQLMADLPSRPESRAELARIHHNRGNLLSAMGRSKEAEQHYDQALTIYKQLAADFPTRPEFRQLLAICYNNRGILSCSTGRPKEAELEYDQALSIQKQLATDFPKQPDLLNDLALTCVNLAILHAQQGNWGAAKRLLLEGWPHRLAALKTNPRHPHYRRGYRSHLNELIKVHAGLLEQKPAIRIAETCRDLGWYAPADAYNAACFLSMCLPIVAKHDKLDDKRRKEAVQFYGDAAMKLLREAVSKGYRDVAHMKKDADLDPLRQREDFQKLVAELEGKGK